MIPENVIKAIEQEIEYALNLGPNRVESKERPHSTGEYLVMLDIYLRRAKDAWTSEPRDDGALHVIRKLAAIAIRCMTDNGVKFRGW